MMTFGVDVKTLLLEKVEARIKEYEAESRIRTRYKAPLIGYVPADDIMFHELYSRKISAHPKEIFRPGVTVIVYFVPFEDEITESNRGGNEISEAWDRAMGESIMLGAHINGTLRQTLHDLGRETSGTNLPSDWDEESCKPDWSHKHAAFLAGLGHFGTAGSFHTEKGFAGLFGSVITDFHIEPSKIWTDDELLDKEDIFATILKSCAYATPDKISLCPAKAITSEGVNKLVCQEFCKKQDQPAPTPDVCGKCFFS